MNRFLTRSLRRGGKPATLLAAALLLGSVFGCASSSGEITRVAYRETTTDDGQPAIRFESDFRVNAKTDQIVYEVTLHDRSGRALRSDNSRYQNRAGHIASGKSLMAQPGRMEYPNVGVNLPIDEIETFRDDAKAEVARFSVYDVQGNLLAQRDLDIRLPPTELIAEGPRKPSVGGLDTSFQTTSATPAAPASAPTEPVRATPQPAPTSPAPPPAVAARSPSPTAPASGRDSARSTDSRSRPAAASPQVTSSATPRSSAAQVAASTGRARPAATTQPAGQTASTQRPSWWRDAESRQRAGAGTPSPNTAAPSTARRGSDTSLAQDREPAPATAAPSRAAAANRPAPQGRGTAPTYTTAAPPPPSYGNTATAPPGALTRGSLSDTLGSTGVQMIPAVVTRTDVPPAPRTSNASTPPARAYGASPAALPAQNLPATGVTDPPVPSGPPIGASRTYVVRKGDTLSEIAQRELGSARRWREIYELNRSRMRSPETLRDGTELILPAR